MRGGHFVSIFLYIEGRWASPGKEGEWEARKSRRNGRGNRRRKGVSKEVKWLFDKVVWIADGRLWKEDAE